jgi:hypothetical protein
MMIPRGRRPSQIKPAIRNPSFAIRNPQSEIRMGLLKHLLFWPVTGPTFLARFAMETVRDTVRDELTDDQAVKEELMAMQMQLELGEIDDDEYVAREAALMQRLREVRQWREEFGMGTSGGPVRVAPTQQPEPASPPAEPSGADAEPDTAPGASASGRGGIAEPGSATVEFHLDWDDDAR